MLHVFELAYTWYEDYSPVLFVADDPATDDAAWQTACDAAILDAADELLTQGLLCVDGSRDAHCWVGWDELVDASARLLEQRGFRRIKTIRRDYWGPGIIDDRKRAEDEHDLPQEVRDKIVAHNAGVRAWLDERRELEPEPT